MVKQLPIWAVVMAAFFGVYTYVSKSAGGPKVLTQSFAEVIDKAQAGKVKDVTIQGIAMTGHYTDGEQFRTTIPPNTSGGYSAFIEHGVNITVKDQNSNYWGSMVISILPFLLLMGTPVLGLLVLLYLVRRSRMRLPRST
jgi:ATP-dependent Zn protease